MILFLLLFIIIFKLTNREPKPKPYNQAAMDELLLDLKEYNREKKFDDTLNDMGITVLPRDT